MENREKLDINPIFLFLITLFIAPLEIIKFTFEVIKSDKNEFFVDNKHGKKWKRKAILSLPLCIFFIAINRIDLIRKRGIKAFATKKKDENKQIFKKSKLFPIDETIFIETEKIIDINSKKNFFIDKNKNQVSTEKIVYDYLLSWGFKVLRSEVSFWQAMFSLSFWDEIFDEYPRFDGQDLPKGLFDGSLYVQKRESIYRKYRYMLKNGIEKTLNDSIQAYVSLSYNTRLVEDQNRRISIKSPLIKDFIEHVNVRDFCFIVYTIAQDVNRNRAGLPDFIAWDDRDMFHIESKKFKEKLRDSQVAWLDRFKTQGIKYKIIRVKECSFMSS